MLLLEDEDKAKARADKDDDPPPSSKEHPGTEPTGKCAKCGSANEANAKYCDQCGESLAAEPLEDEDEDEDDEDDEDKDKDARMAAHPPPPERMQAPAKMSASASLASILGATSDNHLALVTAGIGLRQVLDTAAGITGKTDPEEIVGALLAVPAKLARGQRAKADLDALIAQNELAERRDLVRRLIANGTINRSKIVADVVNEQGARTGTRVRKKYATMALATLRGLVTDLEGDAPKKRRVPFEPDPEGAREAARTGAQGSVEQRIERAKKDPRVLKMLRAPGNELSLEAIAKSFVNRGFDLQGARA